MLATTPEPPYYAVIFCTTRTGGDNGYSETADQMVKLASTQDGFLGIDSARSGVGITVSYWKDLKSIQNWKSNLEHTQARTKGKELWYSSWSLRVARVERDSFSEPAKL